MATVEPSYLVLLQRPLDTVEGIQEVTRDLHTTPVHTDDVATMRKHFPGAILGSSAVLLDQNSVAAVRQWAERHKAIYSLDMVQIDVTETKAILRTAMNIEWPCWMFLHGTMISPDWLQNALGEARTSLRTRPARALDPKHTLKSIGRTTSATSLRSPSSTATPETALKFRPAQDVLSRLRHEDGIDQADYQVIYEDRFAGEMTLDLNLWKTDVSDEEFIPMHRVLKFKRKWDDVVIWDRKARIDLVFGDASVVSHVDGIAMEIADSTQGNRLLDAAYRDWKIQPCMIEFTDLEGGTIKARTFR